MLRICVRSHRLAQTTQMYPTTKRTKNSRQRRLVRGDLPLRTPRRGCGKSKLISEEMDWDMELPAPASATAPAKDGFGSFHGQPTLRC
jgi:hypothetical protein